MKRNKILFSLLFGVAFLLSGCDVEVDEKDRLVDVEIPTAGRNVLIEDFTGQACINCPKASDIIEDLQKTYGADTVIAVGIHSGPFGFAGNAKYPVGLKTALGDTYYKHWGIEHQPQCMVNRQGRVEYFDWAARVKSAMNQTAPLELVVNATYDATAGKAAVEITAQSVKEATTGKLQVWIVEDDIVAMQLFPNRKVEEAYHHHHVFRDAVNGDFGTDFTVAVGEVKYEKFDYALQSSWRAENLWLVAFVYNDNGVQQVVRKKLIP